MTGRLLVPLDGTPLAETAIPLARSLSEVLLEDIALLRVLPLQPEGAPDAEAGALAYLGRVASSLPEATARLMHGAPGPCIVQEAAAQHAARIVMTTHARSGIRRAILGSVAEHVVAHSPAPTILTRGDVPTPRGLRTLLVAIDATWAAPLTSVVELARAHAVRVVLLRVIPPRDLSIWQWQSGPTLDEPQVVVLAQEQLEDVAIRLRDDGIRAEAHVVVGEPVPVVDAFAERVDADLIVMASHGRTGTQRMVQGSVTDAVMRTARRPVMVCRRVPPPPREPSPLAVARAVRNLRSVEEHRLVAHVTDDG